MILTTTTAGAPGAPGAPGLGNYAGFVTPPGGDPTEERIANRYRLRDVHRSMATSANQMKCGRVRMDPVVQVRRSMQHDGARLHGLVSCGSWSACPVCAHRIATARGGEIRTALERHIATGGDVLLVTVTVRHNAGDRLATMYEGISRAWSRMQAGAPWKRFRSCVGMVGVIRGIDATHGPNGWHPHLHVLILTARKIPARELVSWRRWLRERWEVMVRRHMGDNWAPVWRHGLTVYRGHAAGTYVAKLGLAREVSSMHTKAGRYGHRTPFQILADFATYERPIDRALWLEWVEAMYGKVHIYWGRGLRAALIPDLIERPDEDIAAGVGEDEVTVAVIPGVVWDRIATVPGVPAKIVAAARRGAQSVIAVIAEAFEKSSDPPTWYQSLQRAQMAISNKIRYVTAAARIRRSGERERAEGQPYLLGETRYTRNGYRYVIPRSAVWRY